MKTYFNAITFCSALFLASLSTQASIVGPVSPEGLQNDNLSPYYTQFTCQLGLLSGVQCYDPYQMRVAYGFDSLINAGKDGTGKTIVLIDAFQYPNVESSLNSFINFYGLTPVNSGPGTPSFTQVAPDGLTPFDPSDSVMVGWATEIALDVQWSHAMAPGANIVLVLAKDETDPSLISALNYAIDNNLGDIISMSFGENDTCVNAVDMTGYHQAFVNATKKGITLLASTGDFGAAQISCDQTTVVKGTSYPASDPLITAVGGTELNAAKYCLLSEGCDPNANPPFGTYLSEVAWNEPSIGASGGGFSSVWERPHYQTRALPEGTQKQRGIPDVSYNAGGNTGVLTYIDIPPVNNAGFYIMGGTSAGSPQWSALTAIAAQAVGHNYGFINAALYKIARNWMDYANTFHDITSGNNSVVVQINSSIVSITGYNAGVGWDPVTGLGSPKASGVVSELPMFWSKGQGNAAISTSKLKPGKGPKHGHMKPHMYHL